MEEAKAGARSIIPKQCCLLAVPRQTFSCNRLSYRPPTNSQIMTQRHLISSECSVLSYAFPTSSYNLTCFSSSVFALGLFTFLSFCMSYSMSVCPAVAWLWVSHSFSLSFSSAEPRFLPVFILCPPAPPFPLLTSYWLFHFLLDQSSSQGKTKAA